MRPIHPESSSVPIAIGARLRSARKAQGLTIEHVAEASGLTRGFISRIERDDTSPSVSTLVNICQVLSISIGSLFEAPKHEVVHWGSAPLVNLGGVGAVEKLLTPRAESKLQLLRSSMGPGAHGGEELYTINCEIEVIHVLAGELEMVFADRTISLLEGDSLTVSGHEPHSWRNTNDGDSEVLWVLVPAVWNGSM